MARRKKYSDFRNFDKTYARYKRDYYRKARQLYKHQHGLPARSRLPKSITKEDLKMEMRDTLLRKEDFATAYRAYKRDLIKEDSSADPTQYIINNQAYEYSRKQYLGYKRAVERLDLDLPKVKAMDFMTGNWNKEKYFEMVKAGYAELKRELEVESGYSGQKLYLELQEKIGNLYFGSE